MFNIKKYPDKTVLKIGRKIYATITENKNPEYKFMIWFQGGVVLSGYATEQKAIERAEKMRGDLVSIATQILDNAKNGNDFTIIN